MSFNFMARDICHVALHWPARCCGACGANEPMRRMFRRIAATIDSWERHGSGEHVAEASVLRNSRKRRVPQSAARRAAAILDLDADRLAGVQAPAQVPACGGREP